MNPASAPPPDSEFELVAEPVAPPIQNFDPFFAAAVLDKIRTGMEKVKSPTVANDIFLFTHRLRCLLSASASTSWLLEPVDHSKPRQRAISMQCASYIRSRISAPLVPGHIWPDYTNEVLALLERITPQPFLSEFDESVSFPQRTNKYETGTEYLNRVELWVAYHCPRVDESPIMVQYFAGKLWAAQREELCVDEFLNSFKANLTKFPNFAAVLQWFADDEYFAGPIGSDDESD